MDTTQPSKRTNQLALGTMTFGVETDEGGAFAQLDRFREVGGTHIDTADVYGDGESERIIGRWLADRRPDRGDDGMLIATKGRFAPPEGLAGASRPALQAAVDASLSRLGIDHIDLYLVHGWDQETPVAETLETLTGLVEAGKIGRVGWSNLTGYQFGTIVTTARLGDLAGPEVIQLQYNLLDRTIEHELLPFCLDTGITSQAWSPLGGGWLTGKYRRNKRPEGATRLGEDPNRGVEAYDKRNTDRTWAIVDAVTAIASDHGCSPGQVAITWLLTRPTVSSVLLGARTLEQLDDNLGAADVTLSADDIARLTTVSAPGLPDYPYAMLEEFAGMEHWHILGSAATI
ncbi:MAG: aldo/keto reductase [Acidimicrobiia bacterium]|nr:aldo/keto reductase [Acidimicrobiia bacterium]